MLIKLKENDYYSLASRIGLDGILDISLILKKRGYQLAFPKKLKNELDIENLLKSIEVY